MKYNHEINNFFELIQKKIMILSKIKNQIKDIDSDILGFLNDTSAIIATIVALVTIIFTFYNEKVIQTIEELIKEIEDFLQQLTAENQKIIIGKFNEIQDLTLKRSIYDKSMLTFKISLFVLAIPWTIAGLSHIFNSKNLFESFISLIATVILVFVFIYIPRLFSQFNNLKGSDLSLFDIINFLNFIQKRSFLSKHEIIKQLYRPTININYKSRVIYINLHQEIKLRNVNIVVYLKKNRDFHLLVLKPFKKQFIGNMYKVDCPSHISLDGLFDNIKNISGTNNKLYVVSEGNAFTYTLNLNKAADNMEANINQINTDSLPSPIKEALKEKYSFIRSRVNNNEYRYDVKKLTKK
ncbi:hypothetical protein [Priestia aryabhattai]